MKVVDKEQLWSKYKHFDNISEKKCVCCDGIAQMECISKLGKKAYICIKCFNYVYPEGER